ncbi:outer membrane protein W [compost metagenome]
MGVGINYTFYTNRRITDSYTNAFGGTSSAVKLYNTWGGVIKLGVEFPIDENWVFDMGYSRYWIKNRPRLLRTHRAWERSNEP